MATTATSTEEAPGPVQWTPGDLSPELIDSCLWTQEMLARAGIPIVETELVSVGGGLGSFALVDFLRIGGVSVDRIKVLGPNRRPYDTYRYLAALSQIQDGDRLRSDASAQMDNLWGWPSYALREAWQRRRPGPLWNVATEPILSEFYNPTGTLMYRGIDREMERIGWPRMLVEGQVRMVRRRLQGGYFTILTPPAGGSPTKRVAYQSAHVHVAVGYPSLRYLPDLQAYRERYRDYDRVVNSYEPHDHVYEALRHRPGTVVVRGAGIVASRVIQRLLDDREKEGAQTTVVHLFRTYVRGPRGRWNMRRPGGNGFTYQAFTFPKAAGGGQLRQATLRRQDQDRAAFIRSIGGTTTPRRKLWEDQMARGRKHGYYKQEIGEVLEVHPSPDGSHVVTRIQARQGQVLEISADFIIDATGLEGEIRDHRLLRDLLQCGGAGTNAYGRLDVSPSFEVRGAHSGSGRLYASGSIAQGGYLAPVDSFWGVQHSALEITDDLARLGFCPRIGVVRSVSQWWKWLRNQPL